MQKIYMLLIYIFVISLAAVNVYPKNSLVEEKLVTKIKDLSTNIDMYKRFIKSDTDMIEKCKSKPRKERISCSGDLVKLKSRIKRNDKRLKEAEKEKWKLERDLKKRQKN